MSVTERGQRWLNSQQAQYKCLIKRRTWLCGCISFCLSLLLWMSFSTSGTSAQFNPRQVEVPDGFGVNIHFTDPKPGEMQLLADSGVRWIRTDLVWLRTEVKKGQYDFSAYDRLLDHLERHRLRAILILDYGNPLYDGGFSPHTDAGRQAFARWAVAAVKHFHGRDIVWEMYNEPNILPFWTPRPNVDDYIKLAQTVGQAIHRVYPQEVIIGPALAGSVDKRGRREFLEACFKAGLLEDWSAVSIHPYRITRPETVARDYRQLRLLIAQYAPQGKQVPIISGEWGYPSSTVWRQGKVIDATTQAKYLARQWLNNVANEIPLSMWYDWQNDGPDPRDSEHNYGLIAYSDPQQKTPTYQTKSAYRAAQTLNTTLDGFQFNKRLAVGRPDDYVLLFSQGNQVKLAVWTTAQSSHTIVIPASPGSVRAIDFLGQNRKQLNVTSQGLSLSLTDAPQYLIPANPNALLQLASAWETVPLEQVVSGSQTIDLPLQLSNPLSKTIQVNTGSQTATIPPRQTRSLVTTVTPSRQGASSPLRLEWQIQGIGSIAQRTDLLLTNPLTATVLPMGTDQLTVVLHNPAGTALQGRATLTSLQGVRVKTPSQPIRFVPGEKQKYLKFQASRTQSTYQAGLEVTEKGTLHTFPPQQFKAVINFANLRPHTIGQALQAVPGGDAKVRSQQSLAVIPSDARHAPTVGRKVLKITYQFQAGWKYLHLLPTPQYQPQLTIQGRPQAMGLWINGDDSDNLMSLRYQDSTGQIFQPKSQSINWRGWRYLTFALDGKDATVWGGAADGIVHYPIQLNSLLAIDNAKKQATSGEIYMGQPTLVW